ncbi:LSU ribosomal protein L37AE [Archaeoglobus sulfaticallidus PM70-1]|uniref:Large ribosomal subunit protein eL43 n=1 Tax=Archaeoglobus sulfaticallidus PM70-1 TaxID=387631 RepID=N0BGP9_9EURY|nr:50S ribosomal protein L37Ae [Archaeoglobus sulfaticallidus]AGK62183.1 LSU ribosomal protein L37AE [Archaeoglobus sulfaticallidus PM70-1]
MPRTKKVKIAGRFGSRYGVRVRKNIIKIEQEQRRKYVCNRCGKKRVKRVGTGIWECKSCGYKFAGGTYIPVTPSVKLIDKLAKLGEGR